MNDSSKPYEDPRVPLLNDELKKYSVAIIPVEGDEEAPAPQFGAQGSGTCIRIAGRFFVATAAHVVDRFPETRYAVLTPSTTEWVLKIVGGGRRGGGARDALDVAWLELGQRAAALAGRSFLDVSRLGPYRDGSGEDLLIYGAALQHARRGTRHGMPSFTAVTNMWATRALSTKELGVDIDPQRRLYLQWPRFVIGHGGESYSYPDAHGLSGGAVWAPNTRTHAASWRPDQAQLIGIEFGEQKSKGYGYLLAQQIHLWLEMVAEDIPELASAIEPLLAGARFALFT